MISKILNSSFLISLTIYIFITISIFFIWFKLINLENDIRILNNRINKLNTINNSCISPNSIKMNSIPNIKIDDIIMNEVFSCCDINSIKKKKEDYESNEISVEIPEEKPVEKTIEIFDLKSNDNDIESEISLKTTNKKKLQKLHLDNLKEKCSNLNLNTDGNKSELIERILKYEQS